MPSSFLSLMLTVGSTVWSFVETAGIAYWKTIDWYQRLAWTTPIPWKLESPFFLLPFSVFFI
jgi:hypothetical protein